MKKLKPCPFCNSVSPKVFATSQGFVSQRKINGDTFDIIDTEYGYIVMCENCCCQTMIWDKKEQAIKAWNTRVRGV